jgi:S1-C subfamily serine protease
MSKTDEPSAAPDSGSSEPAAEAGPTTGAARGATKPARPGRSARPTPPPAPPVAAASAASAASASSAAGPTASRSRGGIALEPGPDAPDAEPLDGDDLDPVAGATAATDATASPDVDGTGEVGETVGAEQWEDLEEWDDDGAGTWDDRLLAPPPKKSRRQKRKEWRQSERARRYAARRSVRFPIFTRSVILWVLLFAMMGMATGGSAAFFWAHFNTQINELREQTKDFDKRSQEAQGQIDAMRNQAITDINQQIKPIAPYIAESKTIQLAEVFSPYVWFVTTLDEEGRSSVGTAFPVTTDDKSTLLVTSLNTVRAASVNPAPEIELRKTQGTAQDSMKAVVVNYDANRDLALLQVQRGGLPVLDWATDEQQSQALGLRMFPVSGFGGGGASLTSGVISDQSAAGFLHDATIGNETQGGPIVTADAKVLGVASLKYFPLGFDPGAMHFSVSINQLCLDLLECGGGARRAKDTKKPPAPAKAPAPAPGR